MKTLRERQKENDDFPFLVKHLFNFLDRVLPPTQRLVMEAGNRNGTGVAAPKRRRASIAPESGNNS